LLIVPDPSFARIELGLEVVFSFLECLAGAKLLDTALKEEVRGAETTGDNLIPIAFKKNQIRIKITHLTGLVDIALSFPLTFLLIRDFPSGLTGSPTPERGSKGGSQSGEYRRSLDKKGSQL
jgi:hypothetical protein